MEVILGEQPGGDFQAWLLLEKDGAQYEKDAKGSPKLPIFKLAKSDPPQAKSGAPTFAPDTPWSVWRAGKVAPAKSSALDALKKQ
jgi:hypothetical protein